MEDQAATPHTAVELLSPEARLGLRLIPIYGNALADYFDDVVDRHAKRVQRLASVIEDETQTPFEECLRACAADERLSDLLREAMDVAERTRNQRKLRAIGRALALGYLSSDEAVVDVAEMLLKAVSQLESAHIRVLDHLVRHGGRHSPVPDHELARLFPNGVQVIYGLLKQLESWGLAGATTGPSADPDRAMEWAPWDLGILLHSKLLLEG
jgi:exonuclease VII large subunit